MTVFSLHFPSDPFGVLVYIVGLAVLWVVVSVPVYFAAKLVKGERAGFGDALGATLGGIIVYWIVFLVVAYALGAVIGLPIDTSKLKDKAEETQKVIIQLQAMAEQSKEAAPQTGREQRPGYIG